MRSNCEVGEIDEVDNADEVGTNILKVDIFIFDKSGEIDEVGENDEVGMIDEVVQTGEVREVVEVSRRGRRF